MEEKERGNEAQQIKQNSLFTPSAPLPRLKKRRVYQPLLAGVAPIFDSSRAAGPNSNHNDSSSSHGSNSNNNGGNEKGEGERRGGRPRITLKEAKQRFGSIARQVLRAVFGHSEFREGQERPVMEVLAGSDVVVVMPTGGGKSLCYQLPACVLHSDVSLACRVTIVVSPLIALMQNQVDALKARNVAVKLLNSELSSSEKAAILSDLQSLRPKTSILYCTPEGLCCDPLKSIVRKLHEAHLLSFVAVDEAHCISSWGHDFRPSFLKLRWLAEMGAPIIALTATATTKVMDDISSALGLRDPQVIVRDFNRPNILYEVRYADLIGSGDVLFKDMLHWIQSQHKGHVGIVYCRKRETCDLISDKLRRNGVSAAAYHAALPQKEKAKTLREWEAGDILVVVATVAFGMGIDKANVRFVVHLSLPKNLEAFYQESGRAGRDGAASDSLVYYSEGDKRKTEFIIVKSAKENREKQTQHALDGFQKVVEYCMSRKCRRRAVLEHFGQRNIQDPCKKTCDVCKYPMRVKRDIAAVKDSRSGALRAPQLKQLKKQREEDSVTKQRLLYLAEETEGGTGVEKAANAIEQRLAARGAGGIAAVASSSVGTSSRRATGASAASAGGIKPNDRKVSTKKLAAALAANAVTQSRDFLKLAFEEEKRVFEQSKPFRQAYISRIIRLKKEIEEHTSKDEEFTPTLDKANGFKAASDLL